MPTDDFSNWSEVRISLHSLLVIQCEELDSYDNQYVRKFSGPVKARFEESGEEVEIGQIELWYVDGSRAADDGLDIVDVCDSLGQAEFEYASAVYTDGTVDAFIAQRGRFPMMSWSFMCCSCRQNTGATVRRPESSGRSWARWVTTVLYSCLITSELASLTRMSSNSSHPSSLRFSA